MGGRRAAVWLVVTATVALPLASSAQAAPTPHASATTLTVPALPGPRVPALTMTCTAGQVDLNHATPAALVRALGLDASKDANVVRSVIDTRPHNGLDDLLLAAGIGAGRLAKVDPRTVCVTPILNGVSGAVPAVTADFCLPGDRRVDVNADTVDQIAAKLPSKQFPDPQPVAARIVARANRLPFPDLNHVAIVDGVGPGNLAKVRASFCVTPAPYITATAAGQRYGALVYRDSGVQLTFDTPEGRFGLAVPARVLDVPAAFVTITDVAELTPLTPPRADIHIWGPWVGGTDQVYVTTPNVPSFNAEIATTVSHLPAGSDVAEIATLSNLVSTSTTLTTAVTSLSLMQTIFAPMRIISAPSTNVTTAQALRSLIAEWRNYRSAAPVCPADAGDVTYTSGVHGTAIDNEALRYCTFVNDHGQLVVRLAQNRFFVGRGHIDSDSGSGAHYGGYGAPASGSIAAALQALGSVFTTNGRFSGLVPGGTLDIILEPEQSSVESQIEADQLLTLVYLFADEIIDKLGGGRVRLVVDCAYAYLVPAMGHTRTQRSSDADALASCIADGAEMAITTVYPVVSGALMLVDGGASLLDQSIEQFNDIAGALANYPQVGADYQVLPDPRPTVDRYGRAVFTDCAALQPFDPVKGRWWVINDACQDGHYDTDPANGGGSTRPAPSSDGTIGAHDVIDNTIYSFGSASSTTAYFKVPGSTEARGVLRSDYQCMAQRYPVRDWVPTSDIFAWQLSISVTPALCPLPLIPIRVDASLQNWILRKSNGDAFFLDASGVIHPLTTGGAYIDCAQRHLVLDYRSSGEISQFAVGAPDVCP